MFQSSHSPPTQWQATKNDFLALGMNGYLAKPLSIRDMLTEIARVLSGKGAPIVT